MPLGGTGEIGMNMNLYGHAGRWLMVDCGVSFNEPLNDSAIDQTSHEVVCADPAFISARKSQLSGIVITHAHEDHIGAVAHLWPRFGCTVYASPFAAAVLERKLANIGRAGRVPIVIMQPEQAQTIGPFTLTFVGITHSLPEPFACLIETEAGRVFHTADWKIDGSPITGQPFSSSRFKRLGKGHIDAMVCDSTNALREGHSISERACHAGLLNLIKPAKGRVVVGCFSSNIARLITLAKIAQQTGRYLLLLGRSLQINMGIAKATGHWPEELTVVDSSHGGYLLPEEVLAVATGSQGEPRAALSNLSRDQYRDLSLAKGDKVIFSSMIIPGNEKAIAQLVERFQKSGIETIEAHQTELPIHASGHPNQDELRHMYHWIKPHIAIPTHGEMAHMQANADIAQQCHVPVQLVGSNGDVFVISPRPKKISAAVKAGRIPVQSR